MNQPPDRGPDLSGRLRIDAVSERAKNMNGRLESIGKEVGIDFIFIAIYRASL